MISFLELSLCLKNLLYLELQRKTALVPINACLSIINNLKKEVYANQ